MKKYGYTVVFGTLFCAAIGWVLSCRNMPMVYPEYSRDIPVQCFAMLNLAEKLSEVTQQKKVVFDPVREDRNLNTIISLIEKQQQMYGSLLTLMRENGGSSFYYRKNEDVYLLLTLEDSWGWAGYWAYQYSSTGDRFAVPSIKNAIASNNGDPMHYCEPLHTENWYICFNEWMN